MKRYFKLSLLFLFIFRLELIAQYFEICPELGFGKAGDQNSDTYYEALNVFNKSNSTYLRMGVISYYTPESSIFSIKTGIAYSQITSKDLWPTLTNLRFIQVPIGCDLRFGNDYYLLLGLGIYINYLTSHDSKSIKLPLIQNGMNCNLGIGFVINKEASFDLKYQVGLDLSKLNVKEYSPYYGTIYNELYAISSMICLCIRYKIIKK